MDASRARDMAEALKSSSSGTARMEAAKAWMQVLAAAAALGVELIMVVVIAIGTIRAFAAAARHVARGEGLAPAVRAIWLHYAAWILLSLEFALAANLIETVIAPSWKEIGQLGAIAAIRIALGYFLGRDLEAYRGFRAQLP